MKGGLRLSNYSLNINEEIVMGNKYILISFITFIYIGIFSHQVFSQTNVSGYISSNTNWTAANSPYIVTGNTLLGSGFTLTIDPGVIVKFDSAISLQISGTLRAIGTNDNQITFTCNQSSPAPGNWDYILFNDAATDYNISLNAGSIMEYCVVEYAGGSQVQYNGAIRMNDAYPLINHCIVRNNSAPGIFFWTNSLVFPVPIDTLRITNCTINNNINSSINEVGGGINVGYYSYGRTTIISNNTVYGNTGERGGGINIELGAYGNGLIINNKISGNTARSWGGGISVFYGESPAHFEIANNTINDNSVTKINGWGGGIFLYSYESKGNITNNIICNNYAHDYGGGIYVFYEGDTVNINNNIIANNSASLDGGGIYFNNYYSGKYSSLSQNQIIDNTSPKTTALYDVNSGYASHIDDNTIFRNKPTGVNTSYAVYANSISSLNNNNISTGSSQANFYELWNSNVQLSNNVNAINTWWGTAIDTKIQTAIWDYFDAGALSIVNYIPYLTSPDTAAPVTPPLNVIKTDMGGGNIKLTWDANLETDVAGYKIYWGSSTGYSFANSVNVGHVTTYTLSSKAMNDTIAVTAYDSQINGMQDQLKGHESWFTNAGNPATGVNELLSQISKEYGLAQNYPNPFNPTTNISLNIPTRSFVTLKVFDLIGRDVATIISEELPAGDYTRQWNAASMPSGVYFYRLQAGAFIETKKLVLLR
jgi:hypothetical protein